jgi:hypothetical protein
MSKNIQIARLMSKEMDRKDFLKYSGGVLLAVVGVTGLMNALFHIGGEQNSGTRGGYGSSSYGH